jgi:hypothetical protein
VLLTQPLALTLSSSPASAALTLVGNGAFVQTAPFIDGTLVTFGCSVAAPGATSTSIDSCTLVNSQYVAASAPAASSQTAATVTDETVAVPVTTYQVCWTATAHEADGTSVSASGCTAPSNLAGGGTTPAQLSAPLPA